MKNSNRPQHFVQREKNGLPEDLQRNQKLIIYYFKNYFVKRRFRINMIPSINLQVKLIDYALPAPTLISFKNLQTLLQIKI